MFYLSPTLLNLSYFIHFVYSSIRFLQKHARVKYLDLEEIFYFKYFEQLDYTKPKYQGFYFGNCFFRVISFQTQIFLFSVNIDIIRVEISAKQKVTDYAEIQPKKQLLTYFGASQMGPIGLKDTTEKNSF